MNGRPRYRAEYGNLQRAEGPFCDGDRSAKAESEAVAWIEIGNSSISNKGCEAWVYFIRMRDLMLFIY